MKIILFLLVLSNLYMFLNLQEARQNEKDSKIGMLNRAEIEIYSAIRIMDELINEWEKINNSRKMQYLGDVD